MPVASFAPNMVAEIAGNEFLGENAGEVGAGTVLKHWLYHGSNEATSPSLLTVSKVAGTENYAFLNDPRTCPCTNHHWFKSMRIEAPAERHLLPASLTAQSKRMGGNKKLHR